MLYCVFTCQFGIFQILHALNEDYFLGVVNFILYSHFLHSNVVVKFFLSIQFYLRIVSVDGWFHILHLIFFPSYSHQIV